MFDEATFQEPYSVGKLFMMMDMIKLMNFLTLTVIFSLASTSSQRYYY